MAGLRVAICTLDLSIAPAPAVLLRTLTPLIFSVSFS